MMDAKLERPLVSGRRWLQFRMRTLLAFMVLCGVVASLLAQVNDYQAEQHALAELRAFGGSFVAEGTIPIFC